MDILKLFRKKSKIQKLSWSDISIAKFKDLKKVIEQTPEDDLVWALIGACYGMTEDEVNDLPIRTAEEYAKGVAFLNTEPRPSVAKKSYTLNGRKYITTMDFSRISTAQFIDFQQVWRDSAEHPERVLAICLIPEGHKYNDGYSTQEVMDDILTMSVPDSMGLSAFFFTLLQWSMKRTARTMSRQLKKARKEMTKEQIALMENIIRMANSADGWKQSMR